MKVRIEGHTVVVNKMSIYIDGVPGSEYDH